MKRIVWMFFLLPLSAYATGIIPINPQQIQTLGISVTPIATANPVMSNRLPGEIVIPVGQERVVSAPQSGLIDALYVAAGQTVKRGQPLAHVSSSDLVTLQRDYLQARTQYKLARNMLNRDRDLFKDGIIAERRLLTTQSSFDELEVTLAQRRQTLKMSGVSDSALHQLDSQDKMSSGIVITAPTDGIVLEQMASAGQRVDMSAPIYRIGRIKPLWLEIHAPLDILHFAKEGMPVSIPKYQATGKITTIIRNVNRNDQTVHLRAEISEGLEKLSPGQFVEAELASASTTNQFSVPKAALIRANQKSYIFVQTKQGFIASSVSVISEQVDHAVISGNLTGYEKVAVSGTAAIKATWTGAGS